jgi:hypothetical protein
LSFAQDIVKELDVVLPKKAYNEHPNGGSKIINGVNEYDLNRTAMVTNLHIAMNLSV